MICTVYLNFTTQKDFFAVEATAVVEMLKTILLYPLIVT